MNNPSNPNNGNNNPANSNPNTNANTGANKSRPHHRSRKFHRGGPPRDPNSSANGPGPRQNQNPQHPQQQRNNNNRPHNNRRPHPNQQNQQNHSNQHGGGGAGGIDQVLMQYDRLVEQHIEARRKYHELYYRCDNNRLNKLENQFFITAQRIVRFERELRPWQVEQLRKQRTEIYPLDTTYSSLYPEAEKLEPSNQPQQNVVVVQHISPVQKARPSYKDDKEISEGTLEDYLQYKSSFS